MHKVASGSVAVFLLIAGLAALPTRGALAGGDDSAAFIGTWQGSWSGGSSGKFEMTIVKGPSGKLSGTISPKADDGEGYTVEFKTIDVSSGKLSAKIEAPGGEAEITITGSADGKSAKGTYTVRQKSDGTELDTGSWTATKKNVAS